MISVPDEKIDERWDNLPSSLREAVFSPFYNDIFENICDSYHLNDLKRDKLRRLCFFTFLGFIHLQDLYKEIKDYLSIDGKMALDIYHELDRKIFYPFRKEIEENYLKFRVGLATQDEVTEPETGPSQVVLKETSTPVLNLKPEISTLEVSEQEKPSEPLKPLELLEPKSLEPKKIQVIQVEKPVSLNQELKSEIKIENVIDGKKEAVEMGPVILHKESESESISQIKAAEKLKQTSFGGFLGSFKVPPISKPQGVVSKAEIETPITFKKSDTETEEKIPVVVKKYEEPPKTVHYSAFKTDLRKQDNKSEQINNVEEEKRVIDLNKL